MIWEAPLYERLVSLSERQPDAPALVSTGGEVLTFQQLRQLIHVFSESLAANGLSKDARGRRNHASRH